MSIDRITIDVDDSRYVPAMPAEGSDEYDELLDAIDDALQAGAEAVARSLAEKFPQFVVLIEGVPTFFVGGQDPTPGPDDLGQDRQCYEHNPGEFVCTWPQDHGDYPHVAGDGEKIVAVWR